MAHSRSAEKRIRQNIKRRIHNRSTVSTIKTLVKRFEATVKAGDKANAKKDLAVCVSHLDKAAQRHMMHANAAARRKSRLMRQFNGIGAEKK